MVTVCVSVCPMTRPKMPARKAAMSGSRGMSTSRVGFMVGASAPQGVQVFDVDTAPLAEQHHQDRKSDRGLRRRHGEHEEHEHLAVEVTQVTREGNEIEIGGEQQQLDAHQQQDDVLPDQEDARHRDREQNSRQGQQMRQRDHERFSASIFTIRTRSAARTDTCLEMSCTLCPPRLRMVSEIAATIATSSNTAASSNG